MSSAVDRHRGPCPVQEAVGVLDGKWAVAVVGRLARGEARFGRLRTQVTDADGAAVSYRLTPRGRALVPLLDALGAWAADGALA